MAQSRAKSYWKALALVGLVPTVVGMGLIAVESALPMTERRFSLVKHGNSVFLAILIGVACLSIGLIGWAALLGKSERARLASAAGVFPLGVVLVGGMLAHGDMHGVFPLFWIPMAPLFFVAVGLTLIAVLDRGQP